jgi:hypothetical protein
MGVLQRIQDGDLVTESEQFDDGMAADVAGASGDQNADGWILRLWISAGFAALYGPRSRSVAVGAASAANKS